MSYVQRYSTPAAYGGLLILTDPALVNLSNLPTDTFASLYIITDPAFVNSSTLTQDTLVRIVITDTVLVNGSVLPADSFVRILTDPALVNDTGFGGDSFKGQIDVHPKWIWRFVRQEGQLFLIPAKSGRAWQEADRVSADFEFNQDFHDYAMLRVANAWTTHKAADTATLKAAINAALDSAGFQAVFGSLV